MSLALILVLSLLTVVLLMAMVVGLVLLIRNMSRTRGDYYTQVWQHWVQQGVHDELQEDEGDRDAEDADTAVLQSKTGHTVHKKKEWYIWTKSISWVLNVKTKFMKTTIKHKKGKFSIQSCRKEKLLTMIRNNFMAESNVIQFWLTKCSISISN